MFLMAFPSFSGGNLSIFQLVCVGIPSFWRAKAGEERVQCGNFERQKTLIAVYECLTVSKPDGGASRWCFGKYQFCKPESEVFPWCPQAEEERCSSQRVKWVNGFPWLR